MLMLIVFGGLAPSVLFVWDGGPPEPDFTQGGYPRDPTGSSPTAAQPNPRRDLEGPLAFILPGGVIVFG